MTDTNINHLKASVHEASAETSPQKKIASLIEAFKLFSQESNRLESSYSELKEHLGSLDTELHTTVEQLSQKLIELDAITYYLNSILNNISQGILFIDLTGCVTTYNEAAQQILQMYSETVLFHSFWENFEDEAFGFSMREALALQKPTSKAYAVFEQPEGIKCELEIDTSFVLRRGKIRGSPTDAMEGIIVLLRDITEIRQLQMVANRNDRLKELGEMAAMVAHEIRNPLGGIKGFASLLQRDLKEQPELQKMAKYIVDGTDSLNRLVTTVLNYARPVQPRIELTDLVLLGRDLIQLIQADSNFRSDIKCTLNTKYSELIVFADTQLLKSALLNLAVNAIQAMPKGGSLMITLESAVGEAIIKISDTGIGIPPENIGKLYNPFFTTRSDGNGFGLAEVLKIVQAHSGTIEVKSQVGKGTEFTIKIPEKIKG
jgi:signal transduction histidine kinase